jgi:hypothetical protein
MKHLWPFLLLTVACDQPLPTTPTVPDHPQHKVVAAVTVVDECEIKWTVLSASGKDGTLKVRNDDNCARLAGVALYVPIDDRVPLTLDNQRLFWDAPVVVTAGETVEITARVPSCGPYQFDPYHTTAISGDRPNFGQGEHLFDVSAFGGYYVEQPTCPKPEPEPPQAVPVPPVYVPPTPTPRDVPPPQPVCTVTVSLFSYHKQGCDLLPQTFIDGAYLDIVVPATPNGCPVPTRDTLADVIAVPGIVSTPTGAQVTMGGQTVHVTKTPELYQVDLYLGRVEKADLTEANFSHYDSRALRWIYDSTGCKEQPWP